MSPGLIRLRAETDVIGLQFDADRYPGQGRSGRSSA